jgi:hypothetical protein
VGQKLIGITSNKILYAERGIEEMGECRGCFFWLDVMGRNYPLSSIENGVFSISANNASKNLLGSPGRY